MGIGYFIFGNVDSRNYDITVAFKDVDHTPKRVYQRIAIPGRNGEFYLDEKRFEDVPVSYDCIALDDDDRKSFVNALAAQTGHVRLEDTFNVGEFYSAVFEGDVDPYVTQDRENSTFTIQFTRKPQRWLTSGETAVTVSSGGTLTNPTLFEASPLLECKGYGNILVRGVPITLASIPIGNVLLANSKTFTVTNAEDTAVHDTNEIGSLSLDVSNLNSGDDIYLGRSTLTYNININNSWTLDSTSVSNETGESWSTKTAIVSPTTAYFTTTTSPYTFKKGTSATKTYEYTMDWSADSGRVTYGGIKTIKLQYDGNSTVKLYSSTIHNSGGDTYEVVGTIGQVNGYSTKTATDTVYIDLDIGEAYRVSNNTYSSANYAVTIPAKLPTLKPGNNIITYDNTITNFKVTPRWWKV